LAAELQECSRRPLPTKGLRWRSAATSCPRPGAIRRVLYWRLLRGIMTFIPMFTFVRSLPAAFLHAWLRGAGESFGDSARIIRRGGPV